ncbi:hypothetical protein V9K67_13965 [Paraflavisolibacter sp. H34]|uniref:hypothetical protein n=1 Tax=Huijunlia imazamoxiresistens TaxID=3127457 RepID=UPI003016478D
MEKNTAGELTEMVAVLAAKDAPALGAVRSLPGLRAAAEGERVWLRGLPAAPPPAVRALPLRGAWLLGEQGLLFPPGGHTPTGRLPEGTWQPLTDFLKVDLPVSGLPGQAEPHTTVQLVPSARFHEGAALLTDREGFRCWAEGAPQVRLQALRFTVSEQQVLLLGTPLPPLPGKEYWQSGSVLLPCGYDFDPPLLARLLAARFNAGGDAYLLFDPDGSWERVPFDCFAPLSRSAARTTGTVSLPTPPNVDAP